MLADPVAFILLTGSVLFIAFLMRLNQSVVKVHDITTDQKALIFYAAGYFLILKSRS